jgi:guanylate kinase
MHQPLLIVLSSPSGGGKSSLAKALLEINSNLLLSVSVTTRTPRALEIDGKDYHFVSPEIFSKMQNDNELLEVTEILNNFYGTSKVLTEELMKKNKNIIFDIDPLGAQNIKKLWPNNVITIFIDVPSIDILKSRMISRGQDTMEVIEARLLQAIDILSFKDKYDYIIVNNIFSESLAAIQKIIDKHEMILKVNNS